MIVVVFGICMQSVDAILSTLNIRTIFTVDFWYAPANTATESTGGINWATIIFIAGMMVMVEGMGHAGFFRWLCLKLAKLVNYKPVPIFIVFMLMSAFLSMFIDSITVILFLAAVTVELCQLLKCNPVPMIISEVFCANLGGSATMCGDPPNIIIGTSLHYAFIDFLTNTGAIAGLGLIASVIYFYLCFHKELRASEQANVKPDHYPDPKEAITDVHQFRMSIVIFATAVVLLISHANTGLSVATIGTFVAALTIVMQRKNAGELLKKVDYKTLLFFIGLFIVVGGLEQTGVLTLIADGISYICGSNKMLVVAVILWISAIASAFVDNIPFAATMIPVIQTLSELQGISLPVLAWTLSMGTDIGGSATPIGASANVVGISVASREGYPIGWGKYCRYCAPATIMVVLISMICIYVRYF
jgi:Na+/H+ antiporter NhaD/arsenite permease-like protein